MIRSKLFICLVLLLIYSCLALFISSRQMPPTGDEPHYLITAHSLAVDGDILLLNNYTDLDYRIFYPGKLAKRTTRAPDPSLELPAFSPGLSLFLAPFYKIALNFFPGLLVPFLRFIICCVAVIAIFQLLTFAEGFGIQPARVVLAGAALASPLVTYSSQFYPEILAFLFLVLALVQFQRVEQHSWKSCLWLSFLSPALLWLHPKYLILSILVFFIACYYFQRLRQIHNEQKFLVIQLLHILFSVSGIIGFFLVLHSLYGSWSPNRIYGGVQRETSLLELIQTLGWERFLIMFRMMFGYWLDERFGLIVYAPLYAAFFSAFFWCIKNYRSRIFPAAILFIAHFLLICWGAQMGGFSPPSRHMVVLLSVVVLPLLLVYPQWTVKQKYLFFFLEGLGLLVSFAIYTHYRLIYTDATWRNPDGASNFWQWAGMEKWIPNFTATHPNLLLILVWVAVTIMISVALYPRVLRTQPK